MFTYWRILFSDRNDVNKCADLNKSRTNSFVHRIGNAEINVKCILFNAKCAHSLMVRKRGILFMNYVIQILNLYFGHGSSHFGHCASLS